MPLTKNGNNKAQSKRAIMKSLDRSSELTKAQERALSKNLSTPELIKVYDNMFLSRKKD
jgi:hypothetical protein